MLPKLFRHSILCNARGWDFLKQVDVAEACPRCDGALHSATYPRKPHGLTAALRDDVRRFSLCCSVCRRRVNPPSVRFFGWRDNAGPRIPVLGGVRLTPGVGRTATRAA